MKPAPHQRRKRKNPEADIQRGIVRDLRAVLPAYAVLHHSPNEQTNKTRQAILVGMGVHPGFADLTLLSEGRVLFLEVKSKTGRQTLDQKHFQQLMEKQGHGYEIVRSTADALAALAKHGFKTRIKSPWSVKSALPVADTGKARPVAPAQKIGGLA